MAVDIQTVPRFRVASPRVLFEAPGRYTTASRTYDITPDGQRFLMLKAIGAHTATQLVMVKNWFKELKRLVPVN